MDRRTLLATAGSGLAAPLVGCLGAVTAGDGPPERPWPESDPVEAEGTHDLLIENRAPATTTAWVRVLRDDGAALVDGRYELPDERGIEFADVAAPSGTYTVELAVAGREVRRFEWATPACGRASESPGGGSRDAAVRLDGGVGTDADGSPRFSFVVDECDALYSPGVPVGPAETFRLDG